MYFLRCLIFFSPLLLNWFLTVESLLSNVPCISTQGEQLVKLPLEEPTKLDPGTSDGIPRNDTWLFNCSDKDECVPITFSSLAEPFARKLNLKVCRYAHLKNIFICQTIIFQNLNTSEKVLLLSKAMPDKYFNLVHCFGENYARICYMVNDHSYKELLDNPNRKQPHEFICDIPRAMIPLAANEDYTKKQVYIQVDLGGYKNQRIKNPVKSKQGMSLNETCKAATNLTCQYVKVKLGPENIGTKQKLYERRAKPP